VRDSTASREGTNGVEIRAIPPFCAVWRREMGSGGDRRQLTQINERSTSGKYKDKQF
jgi:hypothetical protein